MKNLGIPASAILIISILIQFTAAALALRLVWITKQIKAWALISGAIFLMALRRCFTLARMDNPRIFHNDNRFFH